MATYRRIHQAEKLQKAFRHYGLGLNLPLKLPLKDRQLRVAKPRLRKKRRRADESGEVEVPAYTALQADQRLADRMLELVLNGVSTRRYEKVLRRWPTR